MPGVLLFILSYLVLILAGRQLLLKHGGQSWQGHGVATAAATAVAPVVAGVIIFPFYWVGLTHPVLGFLPLAVGVAVLATGIPLMGWRDWRWALPEAPGRFDLPGITIMVLLIMLVVQSMTMPVIENDALEYISVARYLLQQGNFLNYPVLIPDRTSGLYASSSHPPAFHMAQVWSMLLAGQDTFVAVRLIAVVSALATAALVAGLLSAIDRTAARFAAILLLGTPLWLGMTVSYGVDALRIAAATAAFAGVVVMLRAPAAPGTLVAAVLAGLAMWSHSIGLMVPVFGALAMLMLLPRQQKTKLTALYTGVAGMTGGFWYGVNIWRMGTPVGDNWPAASAPILRFAEDQAARRQLDSLFDTLFNGALRVFTDPMLFGLAFWLAIASLLLWRSAWMQNGLARTASIFVAGFLLVAGLTVLLGTTLVVKNPRYAMTFVPMAAILGGLALAALNSCNHRVVRFACALAVALSAILALGSAVLRGAGLMQVAFLFGNEQRAQDLQRYPVGGLLKSLQGKEAERILSFRGPDAAIYGRSPWLDHYNPDLLPLHGDSPAEMMAALRSRKVFAAVSPPEMPVTLSQSSLLHILADPAMTIPQAEHRGARSWLLRPTDRLWTCQPVTDLALKSVRSSISPGQRLAAFTGIPHLAALWPTRLLHESLQQMPVAMNWADDENNHLRIALASPVQDWFRAELAITGSGLVRLSAEVIGSTGAREVALFDGLIPASPRGIAAQYRLPEGETLVALRLTGLRTTAARLSAVRICKVILNP